MGSPAGYLRHRSVRTRRGEGASVNKLKLHTWAARAGRLVHLRLAGKIAETATGRSADAGFHPRRGRAHANPHSRRGPHGVTRAFRAETQKSTGIRGKSAENAGNRSGTWCKCQVSV